MKLGNYFKHIWLALKNERELDAPLFTAYTNEEENIETLDFMKEIIQNKIDSIEGPRSIIQGFRRTDENNSKKVD